MVKDLRVCAFLSRQDSIVLAFGLGQFKESPHPPHPFQGGPSPRDLPFLVGDDVAAGFFGLSYLLLQGAHLLLGFLLNLLLAVSGKPYLGFELRLLRLSRGIELRELDASGNEGLSYDEYRALLGYPRWQVGNSLGDPRAVEVEQRSLLFIRHSYAPAQFAHNSPKRLSLIHGVVDT